MCLLVMTHPSLFAFVTMRGREGGREGGGARDRGRKELLKVMSRSLIAFSKSECFLCTNVINALHNTGAVKNMLSQQSTFGDALAKCWCIVLAQPTITTTQLHYLWPEYIFFLFFF